MFGTRALVCYTAALLLGMVAARYLAPPAFLYPAAVICVVLLALLFLKRKNSMIPLIALMALMAGFMRAYPAIYPHYPYADDASVVTVEGVVCENPVDTRYGRLIKLTDGVVKEKNIPLTMGVGVTLGYEFDAPKVGDTLTVKGKLTIPKENRRLYDLSQGIGYRMTAKDVGIEPATESQMRYWPQYAAAWVKEGIDALFPETAGTVKGILLGETEAMEELVLEQFRTVGIGHILAVSGLHVGFIAGLLMVFTKLLRLREKATFVVVSLCLWGYCFMIGMPPSAMQAVIMANCLQLSKALGRQYDLFTGLALAALITVMINPLSLFQVGFLMSYGAVLGIGALSGALQKRLHKLPDWLKNSLSISLSAQAGILPISVYTFENWYLFGIISNLLAVPVAGAATTLAFVACLVYPLLPFLARAIAFLGEGLIMVMEAIARFLSLCLPGTVVTNRLNILSVGVLYGILFCLSPWCHAKGKKRRWIIVILIALLIASLLFGGEPWITGN